MKVALVVAAVALCAGGMAMVAAGLLLDEPWLAEAGALATAPLWLMLGLASTAASLAGIAALATRALSRAVHRMRR